MENKDSRLWILVMLVIGCVLLNMLIVSTIPTSSNPNIHKWLFGLMQGLEFAMVALMAYWAGIQKSE